MMTANTFAALIKEQAFQLGFSMAAVVPSTPSPYLAYYLAWLQQNMHGAMGYMSRPDRVARRQDMQLILPGARSLIVVAKDYYTAALPNELLESPHRGRISNYAWGSDYHGDMIRDLESLLELFRTYGIEAKSRAYVDTGPILERSYGETGELGFIGKNTMLIHPRRGSFFFLGEIITTLELEYDRPQPRSMPGCGTCSRCLTACPTNAFPRPYVLDATRCISYWTIEHTGFVPRELRPLFGNWIFGCDICQLVCPWQRFAPRKTFDQDIDIGTAAPLLADVLTLSASEFKRQYHGTAIYRIGRDRFVRNACIAAGNSGVSELSRHLIPLLNDASPIVRGHAVWALGHLKAGRDHLRSLRLTESDETVIGELKMALEG